MKGKNVRLSFMDDLAGDESEEEEEELMVNSKAPAKKLAPIKRMRQAPPPTHFTIGETVESSSAASYSSGQYSKDNLEALKASQKFSLPSKPLLEKKEEEEVILAGEEAEKLMEQFEDGQKEEVPSLLHLNPLRGSGTSSSQVGEEEEMLRAGRKAVSDMLHGKKNDRLYVSAAPTIASSIGVRGASSVMQTSSLPPKSLSFSDNRLDPMNEDWEEELMKRGVISSKAPLPKSNPPRSMSMPPPEGEFKGIAPTPLQNNVDILDIINEIQTTIAKRQESHKADGRRVTEIEVQLSSLAEKRKTTENLMAQQAAKLASIQGCKCFINDVVYMIRANLPEVESLWRRSTEVMKQFQQSRRALWCLWQEDRVLLIKQAEELVSLGLYEPVSALSDGIGRGCSAFPLACDHLANAVGDNLLASSMSDFLHKRRIEEIYSLMDLNLLSQFHTFLSVHSSEMQRWTSMQEDLEATSEAILSEVAPELLSIQEIIDKFILLRSKLSVEEYKNAYLSLSLLQIVEAVTRFSLVTDFKPFLYGFNIICDTTLPWIYSLVEYDVEREGKEEEEGMTSQVLLAAALPWLERGLLLIDLRSYQSASNCAEICRYCWKLITQSPNSADSGITFCDRVSSALAGMLEEDLLACCLPVCKTTPTEKNEEERSLLLAMGAWQGIGRSFMAFQVLTLALMLKNAALFQDMIFRSATSTHRRFLDILCASLGRHSIGTVIKLLKSDNQKVTT